MLQGRIPLILAAVFAVLASIVAYMTIKERTDRIARKWQPTRVMSVKRDMKAGESLTDGLLVGRMHIGRVADIDGHRHVRVGDEQVDVLLHLAKRRPVAVEAWKLYKVERQFFVAPGAAPGFDELLVSSEVFLRVDRRRSRAVQGCI